MICPFFLRLNEGFATYLEYKGMGCFERDWDTATMFLSGDLHRVLELDATIGSHPIVVDVDTPEQITSVFDAISYSKGGSVIRMMEGFMGEDDFRRGITAFLKRFEFKNAVTEDLLEELTKASQDKVNVGEVRKQAIRLFFSHQRF